MTERVLCVRRALLSLQVSLGVIEQEQNGDKASVYRKYDDGHELHYAEERKKNGEDDYIVSDSEVCLAFLGRYKQLEHGETLLGHGEPFEHIAAWK